MSSIKPVVFVSGSHGVGKEYFCSKIAPLIAGEHVTASGLIRQKKDIGTAKAISGIDENQAILVSALEEFRTKESVILLDGHCCLLDENFNVKNLPLELFRYLSIKAIVQLSCDPEVVFERLMQRDHNSSGLSLKDIDELQKSEQIHSKFIANKLSIKLLNVDTRNELSNSVLIGLAETIKRQI